MAHSLIHKDIGISRIITIAQNFRGYDDEVKAEFHKLCTSYLKKLAQTLNLPAGTFSIRSNKGGTAVLGEVTLHSDTFYLQLSEHMMSRFLIRTCKGQKDYTGGTNQWWEYESLRDMNELAKRIRMLG